MAQLTSKKKKIDPTSKLKPAGVGCCDDIKAELWASR